MPDGRQDDLRPITSDFATSRVETLNDGTAAPPAPQAVPRPARQRPMSPSAMIPSETLAAGTKPQAPPPQPSQPEPQAPTLPFVETHCMTCAAGWTRTGKDGKRRIFCLLDREKVWSDMVECSRYEPKEED